MNRACIAGFLPILVLLAGCKDGPALDLPGFGSKMSEEEKIARLLDEVHEGMIARKVYQVMDHVSEAYMDQEGRDYDGIRIYLNNIMKNYREITIQRSNSTILVDGDSARANEAFGTRATPDNDRTPPLNVQGQVAVYLQRENGVWKIVEWGPIS